MKFIRCEQGSDDWHQARCGKVTASQFSKVLNKKTGRGTYLWNVLAERITGETKDSYTNAVMDRGNEVESEAVAYYEKLHSINVDRIGFVEMDDYVGASTDGLVGKDGILEFKCPDSSTHLKMIVDRKLPLQYVPQVQGGILVTERQWCDFVSFDPRVKHQPMVVIRVPRDIAYCVRLKAELDRFVGELKDLEEKVKMPF